MSTVAQGGTISLPVLYRDGSGALVDPSTPLLQIINPSSATVASGLVPTRDSLGQYHYNYAVPALAPLGSWIGRFTGVISGSTVSGDEVFTVTPPGGVVPLTGNLITPEEYKTSANIGPTDTRQDLRIAQWIPWVSSAIRAFTERDFGSPLVTEDRIYEYDGSGYLDVDDAAAITAVSFAYPGGQILTLGPDDWAAKPERRDDSPVYEYLLMPGYVGQSVGSPEMGFTRNLDVYAREHSAWALPGKVTVTGTWGWPDVPGDVKMAAVWTLQEWIQRPSGESLTSESIEGWSRSWGGARGALAAAMAIPARARDVLANYSRVLV